MISSKINGEEELSMSNKALEQTQILIAESENELLTLFREYLSTLGMKAETVREWS